MDITKWLNNLRAAEANAAAEMYKATVITGMSESDMAGEVAKVPCSVTGAIEFYKAKGRFPSEDECRLLNHPCFSHDILKFIK